MYSFSFSHNPNPKDISPSDIADYKHDYPLEIFPLFSFLSQYYKVPIIARRENSYFLGKFETGNLSKCKIRTLSEENAFLP